MVSAINTANVINQATTASKETDVKKLVKYVNNEALKDIPDTFSSTTKSAVGSAALFEGFPLLNFIKRGKKVNTIATSQGQIVIKDAMKQLDNKTQQALKNIFKGKDGSVGKRVFEYLQTQNEVKQQYSSLKSAVKSANKATKALRGKDAKKAMNAIDKAVKSADEFAASGAKKVVETGTKQVGKLGKVKSFMKSSGAGIMLVFSGVSEMFSEVVPTFKELGKEKGLKQLGKSAIKVVGDTAGFIAGEQAGTALGSAIGTAICPGIGTAVGAVCGFVGGMLGSFIAGKITNAITGKSEREIAKEEQTNENSKQIANDTESLENLKNSAIAKIQENAQLSNGELSDDDKIALQSLENLGATNPFYV